MNKQENNNDHPMSGQMVPEDHIYRGFQIVSIKQVASQLHMNIFR